VKLDKITQEFVTKHSKFCSHITFTRGQKLYYITLFVLVLLGFAYRWDVSLAILTFLLSIIYLGSAIFRTTSVLLSLKGNGDHVVSNIEISQLTDDDLPIYTILIPLYHEGNIASKIVSHLNKLDYPTEKLDIKLLLEADDSETISAIKSCHLPTHYETIIVPDFQPKTKPRACNYGLAKAKGKFCVIFDAEDQPDPDQLKKVVVLFNKLPNEFACIQAKLNYYNPKQNWLTSWFTIEYSTTFDLYLPGLSLMNVPIPLGGTSNHFQTSILQELGGWDPFNVTEDCDLGIRIYMKQYKTAIVNSTTWEEANSNIWNWIRQRSRWVKGFYQTHLTHSRSPLSTFKHLGAWGAFTFFLSVGGSSFMMLLNIFYWLGASFYIYLLSIAIYHGEKITTLLQGPHSFDYTCAGVRLFGHEVKAWPLFYYGSQEDPLWMYLSITFFIISIVLFLSNFLFVFIHILACIKRKYYSLIPLACLMPFYWILISIGASKGFFQLLTKPFYWEKTNHGLTKSSENES
jgi:cellulose synthase/poly-beta-1,6-N-acetylglucosamine synthase-like glycosyltransferase